MGISDPLKQAPLSQEVYRGWFSGMTLGDAVRRAKSVVRRGRPDMAPVVDGFVLLGDPAVRLP